MAKREINDYTSEFLEDTDLEITSEKSDRNDKSSRLQYDSSFLEEVELTLIDFIDSISDFDWIVIDGSKNSIVIIKVGSNLEERQIFELHSKNFQIFLKGQKRFGKSFMNRRVKSMKRTNSIFNETVEVEELKIVKK